MINKTHSVRMIRPFIALLLFTLGNNNAFSQSITFPPTIPTSTENWFTTNGIAGNINCDIFDDASGATNAHATAIVWEEFDANSNTYTCSLYVHDDFTGASYTKLIANNARRPDVAIVEHTQGRNAGSSGFFAIAVVYEDHSGTKDSIKFTYFDIAGFFGGTPSVSIPHGPYTVHAGFGDAMYPHIDAFPDDLTNSPYFTGAGNYAGINHFVITWTEDDGSGTKRVYVEDGYFNSSSSTLNNNVTHVGNGEMSDIAGVRIQDANSPSTSRLCHIVYRDGGTDLKYVEYNIDLSTISTPVTLESGTILDIPRIDAFNIESPNTLHTVRWVAVAGLNIAGRNTVHTYNNQSSVFQTEDYCPFKVSTGCSFVDTPAFANYPCVATGPGDQFISTTSGLGFDRYQIGYQLTCTLTFNRLVAITQDNSLSGPVGVVAIPTNPVPPLSAPQYINRHRVAVGVSSTLGDGYMGAWNRMQGATHQIAWKSGSGSGGPTYKPAPASISNVKSEELTIHPNPAHNEVQVNGLQSRTAYKISDITGKIIMEGFVSANESKININKLVHGVYILDINDNNQFKLIKQ